MIIALTGLAGSGKDTAAQLMSDILGGAALVALADGPKELAAEHFNVPVEYFHNRDIKDTILSETGMSPRNMMVSWFDDLFSKHGEDYTLLANKAKIQSIHQVEKYVIITDVRYPIEFEWIKEQHIPLFNIKRKDVESTIDHITEQGSSKGIIIDNDGTIDDLKRELKDILELIL